MDANLVSTRFRQAANDAGLSQYAIAKRTGLTLTEIGNWWHGRLRRPGFAVVTAFAQVLEVSPFWPMGAAEPGGEVVPAEEDIEGRMMLNLSIAVIEDALPELGELMLLWAVLPEEQQRVVAKYIKWEALQYMGGMLGDPESRHIDLDERAREKFRVKARAVMAKKRALVRAHND